MRPCIYWGADAKALAYYISRRAIDEYDNPVAFMAMVVAEIEREMEESIALGTQMKGRVLELRHRANF